MTDPRQTPVNARVAAAAVDDVPAGVQRVPGLLRQVARPLVDLCRSPQGARDRQVLFGEELAVYEDRDGWSFVQTVKDGYVGYLPSAMLEPVHPATHWVKAPSTHVYAQADIKSEDFLALSFGSRIAAAGDTGRFVRTRSGYVPKMHLTGIGQTLPDPAATAALFLGTPYLWGGNSRSGIDCSGLIQGALIAAGMTCPGDSDLQQAALGPALPPGTAPRRNDLLFWRGHVGLVVNDQDLIHATAHHMATVVERIDDVARRIAQIGEGPVTAHIRL